MTTARKGKAVVSLTDGEVLKRAKSYKWEEYLFTTSCEVKRWGLVFLRGHYEDVQFCTFDTSRSPESVGHALEKNWERSKHEDEEDIKYLRAIEVPGLGGQHVMLRTAASSADGELFRCVRCSCIRTGYPAFGRTGFWSAYVLKGPKITAERRNSRQAQREFEEYLEYHRPCKGKP